LYYSHITHKQKNGIMRKKLFEENYQLLKKIAPDLLVGAYEDIDFFLIREPEMDGGNKFIYGTFAERAYRSEDENHLVVGTFYYFKDGKMVETKEGSDDFIIDPGLTVLFNNKTGVARLVNFYNNNPYTSMFNGGMPQDVTFNCMENSKEKDKEEKELNDYLNKMLKEIANRQAATKNYWNRIKKVQD